MGPLHDDWAPRLEEGPVNIDTTANLAAARQAEMPYAYVRLWQALDDHERARRSRAEFKGGTHPSVAYGLKYIDLLLDRTIVLRRTLHSR